MQTNKIQTKNTMFTNQLILVMILLIVAFTSACHLLFDTDDENATSPTSTNTTPPVIYAAGDNQAFTADGVTFNMKYVPGGLSCPIGPSDLSSATITNAYWIGETEVTYALWYKVYTWATNDARGTKKYTFAYPGRGGAYTTDGATPTAATENHPVTSMIWRDTVIWVNALTEWYNTQSGTSYTCVYYTDAALTVPIRSVTSGAPYNASPGSHDNPYVKNDAKGFRLLYGSEWELAARYKGNDNSFSALEYPISSGQYWTPGNYASGATNAHTNAAATGQVAWYSDNSDSDTHEVKGKTPNQLGLYDMSGNIEEWCFNPQQFPEQRQQRGGHFDMSCKIGTSHSVDTYSREFDFGFRIARSQ